MITLSCIFANASELLQYPTWHSPSNLPFKAYDSNRKNNIEADKICLIHTRRKLEAKSFQVEELTQNELGLRFPNTVGTVAPTYGRPYKVKTLMGRILVDHQYWSVPDNARDAILQTLIEQSEFKGNKKVKIFKEIDCE